MKKFGILIIMAAFVFAAGEVYAATLASGTAGTGDLSIAAGTFARQNDAITFTTSVNVYVDFTASASKENYVVIAGHSSGDKAYGMDSTGGPIYSVAKTAGSTTIGTCPSAQDATSADWTGWVSQ